MKFGLAMPYSAFDLARRFVDRGYALLAADAVVMTPMAVAMVASDVHPNGADMSADDAGVRRSGAEQAQRKRRSNQ